MLPAENRVMAQHQFITLTAYRIPDLPIIADFLEQLPVSKIGHIIMIAPDQDLFSLQDCHQSDQILVLTAHAHITQNVYGISVSYFAVPFSYDLCVHFLQIPERASIESYGCFMK